MLQVSDLRAGYDKHVVLRNINLTVREAEVLAVLGTNGAGKSTLLRCLAGLHPPEEGSVHLLEEDITLKPPWQRLRRGLALVPEGQQVFPDMTVIDNLWIGSQGNPEAKRSFKNHVSRIFELFPRLSERRQQFAGTLSGGERQMVAIGRALIAQPKVLLLDEPSHGLAPLLIEQLAGTIRKIAGETAILLVEQNLVIPTECATHVVVLENSEITMSGDAAEILASDVVAETYLGV